MLGYELRALRKRFGLSQAGLGALIHITDDAVCAWELGRRPIPGVAQIALRYVFGELEAGRVVAAPARPAGERNRFTKPLREWVLRYL